MPFVSDILKKRGKWMRSCVGGSTCSSGVPSRLTDFRFGSILLIKSLVTGLEA